MAATIYFTSNRASDAPGVIESLAPGTPPRALNAPPYGKHLLAAAPVGDVIAYTSDRDPGSLMLSRSDGGRPRAVALGHGRVFPSVAFSPDGARIAVSWEDPASGHQRLAIVDPASGHARTLGREARRCVAGVTWSGDGRLLACQQSGPAFRTLVVDLAGTERFSVAGGVPSWSRRNLLAVTAGAATTVVDDRGHRLHRFAGAVLGWSPDGQVLALTRLGALILADADSGRPVRVVRGPSTWQPFSAAGFTPDGSGYAYQSPHGPRLVPLAGGPPRPLPRSLSDGRWSPSGQLAWVRTSGGKATIEVADRLGAPARPAGTFPYDGHDDAVLVWPAVGTRVLYEWAHRDHRDLWRVQADGSGLQRLTSVEDVTGPAFTRDGTRLAYASARFSDSLCGYCDPKVVVAGPNGRQLSAVTASNTSDLAPSWSPDGTRLAVQHSVNGEVDVVTVPGGARTVLDPGGFAPVWSPDGTTVAWLGGGAVRASAPDGGASRTLLSLPADTDVAGLGWSPDGRSLAYSTADGVYVAALDGSAPRLVVAADEPGRPSFSPDGTQLAFAALAGDPKLHADDVFVVDLDGSDLHSVAASPFQDADPVFAPGP
jgi:Tol biopolymer transport system component